MSLALFNAVPAGAIEILYDEQNQPWFKRAHVGKFLDLSTYPHLLDLNFTHEMYQKENKLWGVLRLVTQRSKNVHDDIFISLWCMHVYRSRKGKVKRHAKPARVMVR